MEKKKKEDEKIEEWLKELREAPLDLEPRSMLEYIPPDLFKFEKKKKSKKSKKK